MKKLMYGVKNWKAHCRALFLGSFIRVDQALGEYFFGVKDRKQYDGTLRLYGELQATVIRANGKIEKLGTISKRLVTTAFVNYVRDDLANAAGGADISTFKYHACGTGVAAEAIGDTALGTECTTALNPDSTRAVGTQVNSVAKTYSSVGTLTFDAAAAVTEHGLLSAPTTGVLMDRSVFAAINVASGDSIQFTYTLTLADGG